MTVYAQPVTETFPAYGQVQPIASLVVSAIEAGVVADMKVLLGSQIKAGEALATLTGPEIQSLLVNRKGTVRSAQAQLASADRNLTVERRQLFAQMSTQQAVAAAQSAVAAAQAAFDTAQAQLRVAQDMRTLRAPSAGTVLAINAAEGERVIAGQTILTLQTTNRLWLAAVYYGTDAAAIRVGMPGQFQPASGGAPVSVKVVAVSAALAPDAGKSVGLVAMDKPAGLAPPVPWSNGERGALTINGATQSLVAVPTRALILDQARWWVLVRTPKGVRAQEVVPGVTRGWDTFIERGLSPGQQVVVQNAYLEYHRGIAQHYMPPD
ncbi:MAG: efflux RND transporter periplasmic adaptor subunit [Steroidobacteraceae bacterium]